jgi:hypothetical protein
MEFGAGSVKIEDFNKALQAMTAEGGFAADSMENLSATTEGLFTTLMDKANIAMAQFSEESGITAYVNGQLGLAIGAVHRATKTTSAEVDNLASSFGDLMSKATEPTLANIEELETGFADLRQNLKYANKRAKEGTDEYRRLSSMLDEVAAATGRLNDKVLAGSLPAGTTGDTGGDGPTLSDEERKKIFVDQFNAAAALREENIRLAEATHQVVVSARDEAEALRAVNERMGEMYDLKMNVMTLEEEQPLFDDEEQERIADGTRLLEKAAFAAQHIGQAFSITSQLTEAAFANIKDKSQGFHVVIKQMLEDLLKKAIALAAAFAAMSMFMGGKAAAKGLGSFKSFMMGGLGLGGGIPQMAEGGLFTGASLAMVGEGPGTSLANPEVVAPLDKLQSMMGGGNVTVTGRLDGRDILISSERAGFDRNRVRGF